MCLGGSGNLHLLLLRQEHEWNRVRAMRALPQRSAAIGFPTGETAASRSDGYVSLPIEIDLTLRNKRRLFVEPN